MVAVTMTMSSDQTWYPMEALFDQISVYIDGALIDRHTSTWYRVYDELSRSVDARQAYFHMTNFDASATPGTVKTMYLPLLFWFCRDLSESLPVQQDLKIVFNVAENVPGIEPNIHMKLVCEYIYVTPEEREMFQRREYRFEQMQMYSEDIVPGHINVDLSQFSRPTHSVIWLFRNPRNHALFTGSQYPLEPSEAYAPVESAVLRLSGKELCSVHAGPWWSVADSFFKHKRISSKGIYAWEFGIDAKIPSGAINFSLQINPTLSIQTKKIVVGATDTRAFMVQDAAAHPLTRLEVFAPCWNWLFVEHGHAYVKFK